MWIADRSNRVLVQEYFIDPMTGQKKIVSVTAKSRKKPDIKVAETKLAQKLAQMGNTDYKLSDIIGFYLNNLEALEKAGSVKDNTLATKQGRCKTILSIVGDVYIESLTAGYIKSQYIKSGKDIEYCNNSIGICKTILRWAYDNDYIKDRTIFDKLQKFPAPSERAKIQDKYLEANEVEKLINGIPEMKYKLLTKFLILSGLRIGEALALEWSDIKDGYISVTKTYNPSLKVIHDTAKTDTSNREVSIQAELYDVIGEIKTYFKKQTDIYNYPMPLYIFAHEDGNRITYAAYTAYLKREGEAILGREITPHITRHTHTSLLAAQGVSLEVISRRLGHANSDITREIYLHVTESLKESDAKAISKIKLLA